jgi:hypothetical protein
VGVGRETAAGLLEGLKFLPQHQKSKMHYTTSLQHKKIQTYDIRFTKFSFSFADKHITFLFIPHK